MNYIVLAIFTSFLWSFVNITDKHIIEKYNPDPWTPVFVLGFVGFIISIVLTIVYGVPNFNLKIVALCFVLGVLYLLGCYFYIKALQLDDVSKLIPLFFLSPLLVLPFSILFLGQSYTQLNILGVILMVAGSILVTLNDKFRVTLNWALWFILLSLFCGPGVYVISKYVLNYLSVVEVFCYSRLGFFIAMLPILLFHGKKSYEFLVVNGAAPFKLMGCNQVVNMTGVLISTLATSKGDVTIISALSSLQSIFIIFICLILQKYLPQFKIDKMTKKQASIRLIAIFVIFSGLMLATLP